MLKIFLASTALASSLALGAQAQQAPPDTETTPPAVMENQLPSATGDEPAAPAVRESAGDSGAAPPPDVAAPDTLAEDPTSPAPDPMAQEPLSPADQPAAGPAAPALEEGWVPMDLATISADTLIGADIRSHDQATVASVDDVLMAPDGQIESLVARFGGFLGFGETTVLLGIDEVAVVKDADENVVVLTDLSPEALRERPDYTPPEG